jgi:hypothetical protein
VRNMAYKKDVTVRLTLDDWQTTNEVFAWHVASLPHLPLQLLPTPQGNTITAKITSEIQKEKKEAWMWDRFAFMIHLKDRAFKLHQRVLWLAARFAAGGGEWWDNNSGQNYRVCFREVAAIPVPVPTSLSAAVNTGARVGARGARPITTSAPGMLFPQYAFQLTGPHSRPPIPVARGLRDDAAAKQVQFEELRRACYDRGYEEGRCESGFDVQSICEAVVF